MESIRFHNKPEAMILAKKIHWPRSKCSFKGVGTRPHRSTRNIVGLRFFLCERYGGRGRFRRLEDDPTI